MTKNASLHADVYWSLLRRRWPSVTAGVALGLIAAGVVLGFAPARYVATADVLVLPLRTDLTPTSSTGSPARVNLDTEAQIVRSADVLTAVSAELGPEYPVERLATDIRVTAPVNTTVLALGFPASTPSEARRGALAFAHAYLASRTAEGLEVIAERKRSLQVEINAYQKELQRVAPAAEFTASPVDRALAEARRGVLMRQLDEVTGKLQRLNTTPLDPGEIIHEPELPTRPETPTPELVGPSGLMAGLILGLGFAGLRDRIDRRVRRMPIGPLLAAVPRADVAADSPATSGPSYEHARRLANRLMRALDEDPVLRAVVVLPVGAPVAGLTAQVAVAAARSGLRTLLVPTDRLPDLATSGLAIAAPAEAEMLRAVVANGRDAYELVLVEAPPVSAGTDAQTLASWSDGVVVTVAPGHTRRSELATALGQLERVGAPVIGAVSIDVPGFFGRLRKRPAPAEPAPSASAPTARVPAAHR